MRCMHALIFLTLVIFPIKSAFANTLSGDDLKPFRDLQVRFSLVRKEIVDVMTQAARLRADPANSAASPAPTGGCLLQLEENLEAVAGRFDYAANLALLAARMKDRDDELSVLGNFDLVADAFPTVLKAFQPMLSGVAQACPQDKTTTTASQKLSEIYDDANALFRATTAKIRSSKQ
jgi:hypothetical protein